jgi:hypothetical protein
MSGSSTAGATVREEEDTDDMAGRRGSGDQPMLDSS